MRPSSRVGDGGSRILVYGYEDLWAFHVKVKVILTFDRPTQPTTKWQGRAMTERMRACGLPDGKFFNLGFRVCRATCLHWGVSKAGIFFDLMLKPSQFRTEKGKTKQNFRLQDCWLPKQQRQMLGVIINYNLIVHRSINIQQAHAVAVLSNLCIHLPGTGRRLINWNRSWCLVK